jgi:predicted molibdopterin-dependent oxidoreductase YjgC
MAACLQETKMLKADQIVQTTCPYCGVGCQVELHLRDGLIFRVNGAFDNDVNRGRLCVKGRFGYDYVYAPDRLTQPLVRHGSGSGPGGESRADLVPAGWEEALDRVAGRLAETRERYGPDSIAILTSAKCTNEENYLLQKLARAVIGTNNVDHCARL